MSTTDKTLIGGDLITMNVQQWRQKARTGELTVEEMKLALAAIRSERAAAGAVSAKSTTKKAAAKAKAAPIDSDSLLDDLMGS